MEWEHVSVNWDDYCKKAQSNWAKLATQDLQQIKGNRQALAQAIMQRYACDGEKAQQEIDAWLKQLLGNASAKQEVLTKEQVVANQNTEATIKERDEVIGSPYHRTL